MPIGYLFRSFSNLLIRKPTRTDINASLISLPTSRLVEMRLAVHGVARDTPSVIGLGQDEFVEMACFVYSRIIADRGRRCGVYSGAFAFAVRSRGSQLPSLIGVLGKYMRMTLR